MVAPASGHGSGEGHSNSMPEPTAQMVNRFRSDFTSIYVNEACARVYQTTPQEMIGRNWLHVVPEEQRGQVRSLIESLTPERPMASVEHPVVLHTGEVRWQRWVNCAVFDAEGRVVEYYAVGDDITEQRRADERLRLALAAADAGTWTWDARTGQSSWDDRYHAMYGFAPGQPRTHDTWVASLHPEDRPRVLARLEEVLQTPGDDDWDMQFRAIRPDGQVVWMHGLGRAERDAAGRLVRLAGINLDITERKRSEEALRAGEQRYRALAETAHDMIYIIGRDDRVEYVNSFAAANLGRSPEELVGQPRTALFPPEAAAKQARNLRHVFATGEPTQAEDRVPFPGHALWMHTSLTPLRNAAGETVSVLGISRDITERKRMEDELRANEERFRAIFDQVADSVLLFDAATGALVEFNDRAHENLGYTREEFAKLSMADIETTEGPDEVIEHCARVVRDGAEVFHTRHRAKSGEIRDVQVRARHLALRGRDYILSVWRDVTDERRAAAALAASEQKFRDLAEGMPDGASLVVDGKFAWVNPAYCRMFGYREEELLGQGVEKTIAPEMRQAILQRLAHRLAGKSVPTQYEAIALRKDGTRFHVENSVRVVTVADRLGVQSVIRDITERKRAEEALRESEKKYRDLIEVTETGFVIVDPQGRVLDANDRYVRLTGHERRQEILGRCVTEWTAPDEVERNRAAVRRCFEQGSIQGFVVHYVDRSGKRTPIEIHATVVQGPDGPQIMTLCRDITERKRAEEVLHASEERYRAITENAPDCIFCKDAERRYTFCNPAVLRLLGRTADDVLGKTAEDVLPPEGAQLIREPDEATLRGETINRVGTLRLGGVERVFHTLQVPLRDPQGRVVGLTGISRDITERRRAEEALRASEERYRAISDNAANAIFCKDAERRYTFVNPAALRLLGRPAEEVLGKTPEELFDPGDAATIRDVDDACFRGEIVNAVRALHHGTREFVLHTVQVPLRDPQGRVVGLTGVVRDLTGQRRLADDLRASEAAYHTIFDAVTDAILLLDCETGDILEMNAAARAFARRLGRPLSAPLTLELLASSEEPFTAEEALRRIHAAAQGRPQSYEWMLRDPHGHPIWLLVTLTAANIRGMRCVLAVARETTEQRRAQDERLRVQKLESLGLLAGGIAHDFNNLLMGILASIALARMDEATSPEVAKTLDDAEKAVRRATGLTHQLLTFSRGGAPVRRAIALGQLVRETAEFALAGSNVRAHFQIPDGLWPAEADAAQIGQVIQNLVINAHEAMPDGGVVRITVANFMLGTEPGIPLPPGRYVKVAVRDTGVGIAPENLQRIFDPYFTTKGTGSGLGLAVAYSVLRSHGGHIRVESQLGVGSTFEVFLPAAAAAAESAQPRAAAARRQGRVLVMDDDLVIRRCMEQLLGRVGYAVACAPDGAEAVRMFREALKRGQRFDAVVLDLTVVAGMGGEACLAQLRELAPDVRAIVASGFHTDPVMAEYRERGFRAVVAKPFSLEELLRAIDEARA